MARERDLVGSRRPARVGGLPFALPAGAWLTMFEDTASPRPGTDDLFFAPSTDARPVKPPPVVHTRAAEIPVPIDVLALIAWGTWRFVRRKGRRTER